MDRVGSGGMDTDAIRRAWPNVFGRIFGMRRLTWTFVSQNARVTAFDGTTLTLGIGTEGLTNTFRAGNHAKVVRQALIDELGVDAVVNGVHFPDSGSSQTTVATFPGVMAADRPAPQPSGDLDPPSADTGPPRGPVTDDSAVSVDDEDIEAPDSVGGVGQGVIESVLGGRVITQLDE